MTERAEGSGGGGGGGEREIGVGALKVNNDEAAWLTPTLIVLQANIVSRALFGLRREIREPTLAGKICN